MMTCKICNREVQKLASHLKNHNITAKDYYDKYIKSNNEGFCEYCGKPTEFLSLSHGYKKTCGHSCAGYLREKSRTKEQVEKSNAKRKATCQKIYGAEFPMRNNDVVNKQANTNLERYGTNNVWNSDSPIREKVENTMIERYDGVGWGSKKNFNKDWHKHNVQSRLKNIKDIEKEYNATSQTKLVDKYGQGFLYAKIVPDDMIIHIRNVKLIKNEFIPFIEAYTYRYKYGKTLPEKRIVEAIKEFYDGQIQTGVRRLIYPQELDIYLPELKLAIEFNGTRWHSIELGTPVDYHLSKSLTCRKIGIRLIHIYEFEDLEKQLQLIKELILGKDNYKQDFNKNNFLDDIPKPEIIHNKEYTIYGAGKLT